MTIDVQEQTSLDGAVPRAVAAGRASLHAYATAATGRTPVLFLHAGIRDSRMGSRAYAILPTIRVPTLVVVGLLDEPIVIATMRHAAATIPDARLLEVPDTAHLPNLERPHLFIASLAQFIEILD